MRLLTLALFVLGLAAGARAQTNVAGKLRLSVQIEPRGVPMTEAPKPKPAATGGLKARETLKYTLQQRREERLRVRVEEAIREVTFGRIMLGPSSPASFAAGVPYIPLSSDPAKVEPAGFGAGLGF